MTVTAVIVQARMGSSRLPGKVLKPLAGDPVVCHVLRRARAISGADVVVLATTTDPGDDLLAELALRQGVEVFRGSEQDVLDRYLGAAGQVGANTVMRITCDCPVIDPKICDEVLRLRASRQADFACNTLPPRWPHGLDCEAFTFELLKHAAAKAREPEEREHVTIWMRRQPGLARVNLPGSGGMIAQHRWTLDYPEDLAFFEALFEYLPSPPAMPGWREILAIVQQHPEIAVINKDVGLRPSAKTTRNAASAH